MRNNRAPISKARALLLVLPAVLGLAPYSIGAHRSLSAHARSRRYAVPITVTVDGWSYDQTTLLHMYQSVEPFHHTDKHTLHRTAAAVFPTG